MTETPDPQNENAEDTYYERFKNAVNSSVDAGEFVLKWTAVIEVLDNDGDRGVYFTASEEATPWDILGLLAFAEAKIKGKMDMVTWATHSVSAEDEDDDE